MASCSSAVSAANALIATTTGSPNDCKFSMCLAKLALPRATASALGVPRSVSATPPWYLSARAVATSTATEGFRPPARLLRFKNFSAPRSAPNPASVTTQSAKPNAMRVAISELVPWAMLAKGPPCKIAGLPSSVCTRFGLIASRINIAIESGAFKSVANTGWRSQVSPT